MINPKKRLKLYNPIHLLAVGFGSGLSPAVPGTAGTVIGLAIWWLVLQYLSWPVFSVFIIICAALGIFLCGKTSRDMGVHDHGSIVWDEFVGMWIALLPLMVERHFSWVLILVSFLLFRCFDMIKPWPINWLDKKVHGGLGIMIDDILAGIFAAILLYIFMYFTVLAV